MFFKKLQYYTIVIPFRYRAEQKPTAAHFSSAFQQLIKNKKLNEAILFYLKNFEKKS